jgi:hypothetical protein
MHSFDPDVLDVITGVTPATSAGSARPSRTSPGGNPITRVSFGLYG